jgi:arginase family enzyme
MLSDKKEKLWAEEASKEEFHTYESGFGFVTLRLHDDIPTMMQAPMARNPEDIAGADVAFLGIPWEGWAQSEDGHTFASCGPRNRRRVEDPTCGRTGAWDAPDYVRKCSTSYSWYGSGLFCPEISDDFRVMDHIEMVDYGNVDLEGLWDPHEMVNRAMQKVGDIVKAGAVPLVIGGDHTIPNPVVRAISDNTTGKTGIIWFDGHYDVGYGGEQPRPYSHMGDPNAENAIYHIVKNADVALENICIIGINGPVYNTTGMAKLAKKMGITVFTAEDVRRHGMSEIIAKALEVSARGTERTYISLDLDALDPVTFPAQKYPQPTGISYQETCVALRTIATKTTLAGMDMVCMGPHYDVNGVGGLYATQFYLEVLMGIALRKLKERER